MPASLGVQGPGEMIRCVGPQRGDFVERDPIVAVHLQLERRIDLAQPLHEVVGERIVVIDQQNHGNSKTGTAEQSTGPLQPSISCHGVANWQPMAVK